MSQTEGQSLQPVIGLLAEGLCLSVEQTEVAFDAILQGHATPAQLGGLLMAMRVRGETTDEIIGAVRSMRAQMISVTAPEGAIDTCGTGGDGMQTLNISTAVAFVAAGCGVPIAKHGNRALSSRSGAADVLDKLGVNLEAPFETLQRCLDQIGICFLFAARHHGAIRHVGQSRRELGTRTIFNLLGPLSNPAGARRHLLGVFDPRWLLPFAEVLRVLGSTRAWVVHGDDGMDELTTTTRSQVVELQDNGRIRRFDIEPQQIGISQARPEDLCGGDAADNAQALLRVLDAFAGPYRDIVVLNAAAALVVAGVAVDLPRGAEMARQSIDTGAAAAKLNALIRLTNEVSA